MSKRGEKIKLAYELFLDRAISGESLTQDEIVAKTGWALSSVKTYLSKQWNSFLVEVEKGVYQVSPEFESYPLDVFARINSQKFMINKDPFKPNLSKRTEELISKSRESALLAVQIYNNPMMGFRTPSFIVHMIIAYTAFFHAVFEQDGIEYFYKSSDGQPHVRDGQTSLWDIRECARKYWGNEHPPARKNLEMFIGLRDIIEHRYAPAFDPTIAGECQALLLNYERMIVEEFNPYYSLGASISIPLQISHTSNKAKVDALRELQKEDYKLLKEYVQSYRSTLDDTIYSNPEYTFRVYLVQVPANRKTSSDMTMEFIQYDDLTEEQHKMLERAFTLTRTRTVPVANHGLYKPSDVVKIIQEIEPRFRLHEHTLAWKFFSVRQSGFTPEGCNTDYCQYDSVHRDYIYTDKWIQRLKDAVTNDEVYHKIREYKGK